MQMEAKDTVHELLDRLPDDCSLEDILYHLYVVQAVEKGLAHADAGRTISHEEVRERLYQKWVLGTAG
jgi:predicted transcriptional regulator